MLAASLRSLAVFSLHCTPWQKSVSVIALNFQCRSYACDIHRDALMTKGNFSKGLKVCILLAQLRTALAHCLQVGCILAVLHSHDIYEARILDDLEHSVL